MTRRSVPTKGMCRYWLVGWAYVMPDFDTPNHSIIEWIGMGEPQEPAEEPSGANDNITDAESERLRGIADAMGPNV